MNLQTRAKQFANEYYAYPEGESNLGDKLLLIEDVFERAFETAENEIKVAALDNKLATHLIKKEDLDFALKLLKDTWKIHGDSNARTVLNILIPLKEKLYG